MRQVMSGVYSSTQPPVMTLLWSMASRFGNGPAPMLFLQTVSWWGSLAFLVSLSYPRRFWIQALLVLIIGFWPPLFGMVGTIWRDVHMTFAMLLAFTFLAGGGKEPALWRLVLSGFFIAYASAVRLNAVFSVLLPAAWISCQLWRSHRNPRKFSHWLLICVTTLLIVFGGKAANSLLESHHWASEQVMMVQDLAGISYHTGKNLIPAPIRNGFEHPSRIASIYSAFSCFSTYYGPLKNGALSTDRILTTEDPVIILQIRQAWLSAIFSFPAAFLSHRTAVFAANMGWGSGPVHYPFERGLPVVTPQGKMAFSPALPTLHRFLDWSLSACIWIWRPWVYVWTAFVFLLFFIWVERRLGRRLWIPRLVQASFWLYVLPYYFVAPAADLRYYHWPMAALFTAALLMSRELNTENSGDLSFLRKRTLAFWLAFWIISGAFLGWLSLARGVDFGPSGPQHPFALAALLEGVTCLEKGKFREAISQFETAQSVSPFWWAPETNMGIAYNRLGQQNEARAHFERGSTLDSTGEALSREASFHMEKKEFLLAVQKYHQMEPMFGTQVPYTVNLGLAKGYAALGSNAMALVHSIRCIDLDERSFSIDIIPLASPFFERPDWHENGIRFFEGLVKRIPNAWWTHANLGLLARKLNHEERARQELEEAERLKKLIPSK
ncbi:MAG: hypothetical protein WA705_13800 [Candidatus Ozemobacteraceae bacterium]